jgi:hypothetical protein
MDYRNKNLSEGSRYSSPNTNPGPLSKNQECWVLRDLEFRGYTLSKFYSTVTNQVTEYLLNIYDVI